MALQAYNAAVAITKSDADNIVPPGTGKRMTDAIYVGGAGVVAAVFPGGEVVNFTAVAGAVIPIGIVRVNSTNTTATLMVGLFQI